MSTDTPTKTDIERLAAAAFADRPPLPRRSFLPFSKLPPVQRKAWMEWAARISRSLLREGGSVSDSGHPQVPNGPAPEKLRAVK